LARAYFLLLEGNLNINVTLVIEKKSGVLQIFNFASSIKLHSRAGAQILSS